MSASSSPSSAAWALRWLLRAVARNRCPVENTSSAAVVTVPPSVPPPPIARQRSAWDTGSQATSQLPLRLPSGSVRIGPITGVGSTAPVSSAPGRSEEAGGHGMPCTRLCPVLF
jgi:hypothetical protein